MNGHSLQAPFPGGIQLAMFGMGCFWGAALASLNAYRQRLDSHGPGVIITEVIEAPEFCFAEHCHQQCLAKNPRGYCGPGGTGVTRG